jgi:hypothetical protein
MFDKWKIRHELCKAYKIYDKKAHQFLYSDLYTSKECNQLYDIKYAIAYVLCEYFDFNYKFYYENPFSYKWYIAWDYMQYYDECKEAYEKITKQNKINHVPVVWVIHDFKSKDNYSKGDIMYNVENRRLYYYNGKNFIEIVDK